MRSARFWVVLLFMAATAIMLHHRGDIDRVPPSAPLDRFPSLIGSWGGTDVPISQDALDILGHGSFLNRVYQTAKSPAPSPDHEQMGAIGLFIGYFPTQRSGQSIHSPQNCLPGAGWAFESQGVTEITGDDGKVYRVGEYVISNGTDKQEVFYWYQSHGRSIANDYAAKFYMLRDSILYNRTDAALVRVITPIRAGENQSDAHRRAAQFTGHITPLLSLYIPN